MKTELNLTLLLILFLFLNFKLIAQDSFTKKDNTAFIDNSDLKNDTGKIIKSIVGYQTDNTGNKHEKYEEKKYNEQGLLLGEYNYQYYYSKEFKYDSLNRITEVDALHGESFANGTTKYSYEGNKTFEKEFAMGYYSESVITKTVFDSISRIEWLIASGDYSENKFETHQYYFNEKNQIVKLMVNTTFYDLDMERDDLLLLGPADIKKKLFNSKVQSKEEILKIYEYNQDGNIKLDIETYLNSGRILKAECFYDKNTKQKTREVYYNDSLLAYDWYFEYNENGQPAKEIKHNYEKVFSDYKNNVYTYEDMLITFEYFYNTNADLVQIKESYKEQRVINQYFKKGKLIKKEEHNSKGEWVETIDYEYVYW